MIPHPIDIDAALKSIEELRSAYSTLYRNAQQALSCALGGNAKGAAEALQRGLQIQEGPNT